jgi:hypothetical protein
MARTKQAYTAVAMGGLIHVEPLKDGTETPAEYATTNASYRRRSVPAIDAQLPDGRRVYITLEMPYSADTSRDAYTKRMRLLAQRLLEEADRRDANKNR